VFKARGSAQVAQRRIVLASVASSQRPACAAKGEIWIGGVAAPGGSPRRAARCLTRFVVQTPDAPPGKRLVRWRRTDVHT